MRFLPWVLVAATTGAGCVEEVDRQARKRIFSAEDPPRAVASASERLDVEQAESQKPLARRILTMGAAEVTERLGSHRYKANITFDWSHAGRNVRLEETRSLKAGVGGVQGDFHAVLENNRDQGLEVLRVDGKVYARSRYGKFRQRLRDRGMAEREREEISGALKDVYTLFDGRVALTPVGTVRLGDRQALKFRVALAEEGDEREESELPEVAFAKGGVDESTRLRLEFYNGRKPQALQGEVLVCLESAVVLRAKMDGKLSVARARGNSLLRLSMSSELSELGKAQKLRPPTEFLPDEDKPLGIADALERFGYSTRARADAGTPAEPQDE